VLSWFHIDLLSVSEEDFSCQIPIDGHVSDDVDTDVANEQMRSSNASRQSCQSTAVKRTGHIWFSPVACLSAIANAGGTSRCHRIRRRFFFRRK